MPIDVQILLPDTKILPSIYVSYGSFYILLTLNAPYPTSPLTVTISETPDLAVGPTAFRLPSTPVGILDLVKNTKIDDPTSMLPWRYFNVTSLASFALIDGYPRVKFLVSMKTDDATLKAFKGSKMTVTVIDGGGHPESKTIPILVADPNNHYHWRSEPTFVDGAWFKAIHIDAAKQLATPFFFLYGVSNPTSPSPTGESFVMAGRGGAITLDPTLRVPVPPPSATPPDTPYDPIPRPAASAYTAETFYGLDAKVSSPTFAASDINLNGFASLPSGGSATWSLHLTKLYTACVTDWNPLSRFQRIIAGVTGTGTLSGLNEPWGKLSSHTVSFIGMSAFYMSHNMNSFVSGSITWDGTPYTFSDTLAHKAYQDSNWGAGGFPHPYVWMQANNFYDGATGNPLHDTSLVALYTPLMPVSPPVGSSMTTPVGGICLQHAGTVYEVIVFEKSVLAAFGSVGAYVLLTTIPQLGTVFDCSIDFVTSTGRATLDMTKPATISTTIGAYPRTPDVHPIRWTVHGTNAAGDDIMIVAECDPKTVMFLAAPMVGVMKPSVTKETLLARFTVTLKPAGGGAPISLVSDFGTAEYGD